VSTTLPALLLAAATGLMAQGLPRNIEMSLVADTGADTSAVWVVNSEGQVTRIRGTGSATTDYLTREPGVRVVNPAADYPVWKGVSRKGRLLFPVATTDTRGRGLLAGFWKHAAAGSEQIILSNAVAGTLRPVPDAWAAQGDTLLGTADSTQILWQLDGNDSLRALGLSSTGALVDLARCGACNPSDAVAAYAKAHAAEPLQYLQGIAYDSATRKLLLAATTGLWIGVFGQNLSKHPSKVLGDRNVLGVWAGPGGLYAQTDSSLWYLTAPDSTPRQVRGDSALVVDHRIGALAWSHDTAWVLVRTASYGLPGIVRLKAGNVLSTGTGTTPSLLDAEDSLPFSKDVNLSDIVSDPAGRIWVASRGEGVAMTADAGRNWTLLRHQSSLKAGLKEVRVFPTRLESGTSLIGYSLSENGNVDIEIFNGAMEPVRTIVRSAPRPAQLRSENTIVDRWDGCTDGGKLATIGLYYVRVKSGSQVAWGKVFQLKGGASCTR